jgi:alanine dehydrogenase
VATFIEFVHLAAAMTTQAPPQRLPLLAPLSIVLGWLAIAALRFLA